MSYVYSLFHIVFCTNQRQKVLIGEENRTELYTYIWGIIKNHHSKLVRINGMEEHVHLLVELSATESLSDLVKEIKRSTNIWIKQSGKFPSFSSWAHEYGAFSCSYSAKEIVRQYIIHQQEHHKKVSFEEELEKIIEECGMERYEHKDET